MSACPPNCAAASPGSGRPRRRDELKQHLAEEVAAHALRLRPLLELVERVRPHLDNDSVFTSRRGKMSEQLHLIQEQLRAEQPRREALARAFTTLTEFVAAEAQDVSRDEVKESAKRLVLVALKTAPDLIRAAHTAGLFN